ncbi:hypothetical protein, partial [Mycobacterium tuberculosis]
MEEKENVPEDKVPCPHCKEKVDSKATKCPHCRGKITHSASFGKMAIVIVLGVIIFTTIASTISQSSQSATTDIPA